MRAAIAGVGGLVLGTGLGAYSEGGRRGVSAMAKLVASSGNSKSQGTPCFVQLAHRG